MSESVGCAADDTLPLIYRVWVISILCIIFSTSQIQEYISDMRFARSGKSSVS